MADFLSARGKLPARPDAPSPEAVIAASRGRPDSIEQHWFEQSQKLSQQIMNLIASNALLMEQLQDAMRGCKRLNNKVKLLEMQIEKMKEEAGGEAKIIGGH
jgi:hypothetical protein